MEGDLSVDPTTGTTIFDSGERPMPGGADEYSPDVDAEGRGDVFGVPLSEEAAPAPQPTAPAAAPAPTPPAAAAPPADVQEIERAAAADYQAAIVAQQEGQALYRDATSIAQQVAARREQAETAWVDGVTPTDVTRFIAEQHRDTAAAVHSMERAQGKLAEARSHADMGEAGSMWSAIKSRFPNVDPTSPALGKLGSDLLALRRASRFTRGYTELLEEHLEGIRSHLGASAPPSSAPAAAPGGRLSGEDARTFGLA